MYATVLNTKTNTDGYKQEGITYPSIDSQYRLMTSTMRETGIDPLSIKYVEAHMTGTPAGDVVESESIRRSFCEGRSEPLLMGCLKSNLGHTEGASGTCALSKVCLAFENYELPPNLNFNTPNPNIDGLRTGILKPVTERMPFKENVVAVSSFGFGGCNVFSLLRANEKLPTQQSYDNAFNYKVPRLTLIAGRTENSMHHAFNYIESNEEKVTNEFFSLLDTAMNTARIRGLKYRGYCIYDNSRQRVIKGCKVDPQPVWLAISGICNKWCHLPQEMLNLQPIAKSLERSGEVAKELGINLSNILHTKCEINLAQGMVAIAAIQIALVDLMKCINVTVDGIIGHSIGEIACGYADGGLNQQQALAIAYYVAKELMNVTVKNGSTGLEWDEIGLHTDKVKSIFAGIRNSLDKNVFQGRSLPRTSRWMASFTLGGQEVLDTSKLSAEYYAYAFTCKISFREMLHLLPKNAAVVEIAPQPMLETALKRGLGPDASVLQLINLKVDQPCTNQILENIGKLYMTGACLTVSALYPPVEYPVPRGTLSISPIIQWDHSKSCVVTKFPQYFQVVKSSVSYDIDLMQTSFQYLSGHIIDGRNLCPAVEYLRACWETLVASLHGVRNFMDYPVEFRKVKFSRGIMLSNDKPVEVVVRYQKDSGAFEALEGGNLCCSGYARLCSQSTEQYENMIRKESTESSVKLDAKSIYKELRVRGYDYGPSFQGIVEATSDSSHGRVKWMGQWVSFVDSMLQIAIIGSKTRELRIPTYMEYVKCDAKAFMQNIEQSKDEMGESIVDVYFDREIGLGVSKGMVLIGLKTSAIPRRNAQTPIIEKYTHSPYIETDIQLNSDDQKSLKNYVNQCNQLIEMIETLSIDEEKLKDIRSKINDTPECSLLVSLDATLTAIEQSAGSDEEGPSPQQVLQEKLDQSKSKFSADLNISLALACEKVIRHQIDTTIENICGRDIRILECNRTSHLLVDSISELLEVNSFTSNHTVLHTVSKGELIKGRSSCSLVDWKDHMEKKSSVIPSNLNENDLIVIKDDSTGMFNEEMSDIKANIVEAYNKLKVGGFLLIFYRESVSQIEEKLIRLSEKTCLTQLRSTQVVLEYAKEADFCFVSSKKNEETNVISLLLRRPIDVREIEEIKVLPVDSFKYDWIDTVKMFLLGKTKTNDSTGEKEESPEESRARRERSKKIRLWLTSNDQSNGIIGLVNCLRREPGCESVRCYYDPTSPSPITSIDDDILRRDLVITVRDASTKLLGSMRHSLLQISERKKSSNHAYVDIKTKGDMSSFRWLESSTKYFSKMPLECRLSPDEVLVNVFYAALNFKDVMVASGRISSEAYPSATGLSGASLGMEFSGTDANDNRVMGYTIGRGMATEVSVLDSQFLWPVPDSWSLKDASTVPVVYATVYYALFIRGKLLPGESVLIHSGAGGVGQAAIYLCQSIGCKIFTTCSSGKRDFLKNKFNLRDEQMYNSRDATFEEDILRATDGSGVDVILNSLSEEKLKASISCLAVNGRFIEIGKYDILVNNNLDISKFGRNQSFEVVCLAHLDFNAFFNKEKKAIEERKLMYGMMCEGLRKNIVKPLDCHVYDKDHVEDAFRFMASGKHTGKVLIQIREEEMQPENGHTKPLIDNVIQQTLFDPNKSYIIAGGLGGFGLELTYWLVSRGAKKIILTSRTGIREAYQSIILERMQECSPGCTIAISTDDITNECGVETLLSNASKQAPIGGIFNLAMVLTDAALENQDEESFEKCCKPKIHSTYLFDKLSRRMCPQLEYFVCFSSVVSGRGNAGQSNYGFANSYMEQVCQNRLNKSLPALAIQWGAVGDVGIVAELLGGNDVVIGGYSVPQRIHSCLDTLDRLLSMSNDQCAIVSSVVKVTSHKNAMGINKGDLLGTICHILGIKNASTLDPNSTLAELGMDSLMAIEIKQGLEREFDIVLSTAEIRNMTIKRLKEMQAEIDAKGGAKSNGNGKGTVNITDTSKVTLEEVLLLPKGNLCRLNNNQAGKPIICFGPIEGSFRRLIEMCKYVNRPMIGLNWTEEAAKIASIKDVAAYYIHLMKQNFPESTYDVLGFDFGGLIALEVAAQLQLKFGDHACKKVGLIESSPDLMKMYADDLMKQAKSYPDQSIDPLYNLLLVEYVKAFFDIEKVEQDQLLFDLSSFKSDRKAKLTFIADVFNKKVDRDTSEESAGDQVICDADTLAGAIDRFFKKIQLCSQFTLSKAKLPVTLGLQKSEVGLAVSARLDKAYNLSAILAPGSELPVGVFKGDHKTIVYHDAESIGHAVDSFFLSIVCA